MPTFRLSQARKPWRARRRRASLPASPPVLSRCRGRSRFSRSGQLLEQLLTFLVSFVDTIQAGHLDPDAVAAVGIAGYIIGVLG